jgi:hypothetical protein
MIAFFRFEAAAPFSANKMITVTIFKTYSLLLAASALQTRSSHKIGSLTSSLDIPLLHYLCANAAFPAANSNCQIIGAALLDILKVATVVVNLLHRKRLVTRGNAFMRWYQEQRRNAAPANSAYVA